MRHLQQLGVRLLPFWNTDVLQNIDGVMESILKAVRPPHPDPLPPQGERG
jgi:very-short-patch-repair endonuclease